MTFLQGAGSPHRPAATTTEVAVEETAERLAQTEQLLSQLKMMIREKDAALGSKDEQLKVRHLVSSLPQAGALDLLSQRACHKPTTAATTTTNNR